MRIAVATVHVPFISGGAELMTSGLCKALSDAGHRVEQVSMPFRFNPRSRVLENMSAWGAEDFDRFDCGSIDEAIALKFPAFYLNHHSKRVWLMHQHRSCYELWDTPFGDSSSDPEAVQMRAEIIKRDSAALSAARKVFTISQTVSERLLRYNGIASTPLLQPPPNSELFHSGEWLPYIFAPSRLESLKRQDLLVRAMAHVNQPVFAVLAGEGGQRANLDRLVDELGLRHRVRFLGRISDVEMRQWYANSLAVFFGPLQEDYGFVTLEAMLSSRAVVTCEDSGGPVHFVRDAETGYVCHSDPKAIADRINELWGNRSLARRLGENARECYDNLGVSWERVVTALLAP